MRVANGKAVRVRPGDELFISARLNGSRLGRLYVFASEGGAEFSPYVANLSSVTMLDGDGMPRMMSTISLRLVEARPSREISFVSDIDGFIRVMEELDARDAPRARVRLKRIVCRDLPWTKRLFRILTSWSWPQMAVRRRQAAA
jgi:hypothetical protein